MPSIAASLLASNLAVSLSLCISGRRLSIAYSPADVNSPGCQSPPPSDFLIDFNLAISSLLPIIIAPIGQHSPLVRHMDIVSKQFPISFASIPFEDKALNILAPSIWTFTLSYSAICLIYRKSPRLHALPRKVPFSKKTRSVSGKVMWFVDFLILSLTSNRGRYTLGRSEHPSWGHNLSRLHPSQNGEAGGLAFDGMGGAWDDDFWAWFGVEDDWSDVGHGGSGEEHRWLFAEHMGYPLLESSGMDIL